MVNHTIAIVKAINSRSKEDATMMTETPKTIVGSLVVDFQPSVKALRESADWNSVGTDCPDDDDEFWTLAGDDDRIDSVVLFGEDDELDVFLDDGDYRAISERIEDELQEYNDSQEIRRFRAELKTAIAEDHFWDDDSIVDEMTDCECLGWIDERMSIADIADCLCRQGICD